MSGKYALVVGNSQYDDPRLAQLTAPGRDAEDLARILSDKAFCAFDDVRVLLNQAEPVVREAIDEFFDEKLTEDLLLLYFSGHGVRDELGALYLAVKNTNRSRLRSTAIKSDFIHEAMEQSRARRQVLILDCCNSGAFEQGTKAATGGSIGIANAFGGYGRVILTASDSLQYAWQGDAVLGSIDNSLFTHFLVQGLKGEAEADGDGLITVDELYDYAYEQVRRATPNQTPSKFSNKQEGEIILRQITQLDQIKAAPLPTPLVESMENPLAAVRLGAVQELARVLRGKNLGLARSAREALESMCTQDDSLSVRKAASDALEPILSAEREAREKAEQEQAEAERLAAQRAEEERLAAEKSEADRLTAQKAQQERLAAERLAAQQAQAEQIAQQEAESARLAKVKVQEEQTAGKKAAADQASGALQPGPRPRWILGFGIAVGCAIAAALANLIPLDPIAGYGFYGALAGLVVAGALNFENFLEQWQGILWTALGWAVGWAVAGAIISANNWWIGSGSPLERIGTTVIAGAIAGVTIALNLRGGPDLSRRNRILPITLAWTAAAVIDTLVLEGVAQSIWNAGGTINNWAVPNAISAAIDAGIGGFATIWLIRTETERAGQVLSGKQSLRPKWLAIPWIALGFVISVLLVWGISGDQLATIAMFGGLAGLGVAVVLRIEDALREWKSVLWVTLGWLLGWAILGIIVQASGWNYDPSPEVVLVEPLAGAIAGLALALVLRMEGTLSSWDDIVWITLIWAVAAGLDGWVFQLMFQGIFDPAGMAPIFPLAISAALDGALGSLVTIWRIRRASAKRIPA